MNLRVLNTTFGRYLARTYLLHMLALLAGLLGLIYLFDTIELLRRASKIGDMPLSMVFVMALFKMPEMAQILLPFAILFSAMFTFWSLTRRYELIVARSSGFSIWQFLSPVIIVAIGAGLLQMTILNPFGAFLVSQFDKLENKYLKKQESQIALFKEGLWLRQGLKDGYIIMNARKFQQADWSMKDVSVFFFDAKDSAVARLQARQATLRPGRWNFEDVVLFRNREEPLIRPVYALPTHLTRSEVEDSFSSPAALSFWSLPGHIQTLEETGFDAAKLKVHYHNLIAQPLLFAAMILLAAAASMRPPRERGGFWLILTGVMLGFAFFFFSTYLQAMGAAHQVPVLLAAWAPPLIGTLLGLGVILNLEDG